MGTTPRLPFHSTDAGQLHLSLLLILLFSSSYFLFSEVSELGSKPVHTYLPNVPIITLRFSIHYFVSFFQFLFPFLNFTTYLLHPVMVYIFLMKYLKTFLKRKGRVHINNIQNMIFHLRYGSLLRNFPSRCYNQTYRLKKQQFVCHVPC